MQPHNYLVYEQPDNDSINKMMIIYDKESCIHTTVITPDLGVLATASDIRGDPWATVLHHVPG